MFPFEKTKFENISIKDKLKKAVAIGAATAVFGGAGGVGTKEALADASVKTKGNIASVESSQSKNKMIKREKELLEKYRKAKKEAEDSIRKITEVQDNIRKIAVKKEEQRAEKIKNELIEHIDSEEYFNKLKFEFGGDVNRAKAEQIKRIENLKQVRIEVLYFDEVNEEYKKYLERKGTPIPADFQDCWGFYDPDPDVHKIFISIEQDEGETILHELLHASTRGVWDITDNAKNMLKGSYKKIGDKEDKYFNDSTERLVSKQILDRELEKLGIKKYGETFTDEHYKKMMEHYRKGRLSEEAEDFIRRTKPKDFKKIFNEIAENKSEESSNIKQA